MKKKFFLTCVLCGICLLFFGCGANTLKLIQENLSEITKVYYYGENETATASLSYGQREKDYATDGKSGELVEFCLLSVKFNETPRSEAKNVTLTIDGEQSRVELFRNPKNGCYMLDLERNLSGQEQIMLMIDEKELMLDAVSNKFKIDYNKALVIASEQLEEKILKDKSFNNLNAECYLRVLDKRANDLDGTYWIFTAFNKSGENYSVIISTEDGSIFTKSK